MKKINGLSLFSGIGGLDVALSHYVKTIAYCEIDPYCKSVLLQRMREKNLSYAPIWNDIKTLDEDKIKQIFKGQIDIIFGGFPCQDISIAGNGKGLAGERSGLFFEIIRLCKELRPKFIFVENVPAITARGGIRCVSQIASLGYDCRWMVLPASSIGACHKRERFFLLAYANCKPSRKTHKISQPNTVDEKTWVRFTRPNRTNETGTYWKKNKCPSFGMDDGLAFEVDRAKALGNAVVPLQARKAFEILLGLR